MVREKNKHNEDVVRGLLHLLEGKQFGYYLEGFSTPYSNGERYTLSSDDIGYSLKIVYTEKSFLENSKFKREKLLKIHRKLLDHHDQRFFTLPKEQMIRGEEVFFNSLYNLAIKDPEVYIYSREIQNLEIKFNQNDDDPTIYQIVITLRESGKLVITNIEELQTTSFFKKELERIEKERQELDDLPF